MSCSMLVEAPPRGPRSSPCSHMHHHPHPRGPLLLLLLSAESQEGTRHSESARSVSWADDHGGAVAAPASGGGDGAATAAGKA